MTSLETIRSWPRHIKDITEVPGEFKDAFMNTFDYANDFPYCIFSPENKTLRFREPPKLICMQQDTFYLFQPAGQATQIIAYPIQDIRYLEHGHILLLGWLDICGLANGRPSVGKITFTTTREELFRPFIERFRTTYIPEDKQAQSDDSIFDTLIEGHYKFMHYGIQAMQGGEKVLELVFQPGQRVKLLRNIPIYKKLSTATLFIRTQTELIIVKEQGVKTPGHEYGAITDYIPLHRIGKTQLTSTKYEGVYEWALELQGGSMISIFISEDNKERMRTFPVPKQGSNPPAYNVLTSAGDGTFLKH